MSDAAINGMAAAYAGSLMGVTSLVVILGAEAASAGLVVGVGVVLLLFTMIRKGGIGSLIFGAISTVGTTVTTVGQSTVQWLYDRVSTAEAIAARAKADAARNRADNIAAVKETIEQIFELLSVAFDSSKSGLKLVADSVVGYNNKLIPPGWGIPVALFIYLALTLSLVQFIKVQDNRRVRAAAIANMEALRAALPAQPAQAPGGVAGLLGMGGATRHRTSLPTRRVGRSSSSSKRNYTHRRRALRTGKVGYRPTKTGRKV
jgi:hypothetical protein